jgi:hypothetical protein
VILYSFENIVSNNPDDDISIQNIVFLNDKFIQEANRLSSLSDEQYDKLWSYNRFEDRVNHGTQYRCMKISGWEKVIDIARDALDYMFEHKMTTDWKCAANCTTSTESTNPIQYSNNNKKYPCPCLSDAFYTYAFVSSDHIRGFSLSTQCNDYKNSIVSFGDHVIPYMWGDAGVANLCRNKLGNLELRWDCC